MPNNFDFTKILEELFLFTGRPSSIQRDTLYGSHFGNNKYHGISYIVTYPVSATDVEWYFKKKDCDILFDLEAKEFFKSGFLKEYKDRDRRFFQSWIKICNSIDKIFSKKIKKITPEIIYKIKALFDYSSQDNTYFYFALSIWTFEQKVLPKFKTTLQETFGDKFDELWTKIIAQTQLSDEQKFRIKLAELKKISRQKIPVTALKKLTKEYRYLGIYNPEDYGFNYETVLKIYKETDINKTLHLKKEISANKKIFQNLINKTKNKKIVEVMSLINYNVFFRNTRSEKLSMGFALLTPFYDFLMKKLNFERPEVGNLIKDEIIKYLESEIKPKKRIQHPGMLYMKGIGRELSETERKLFKQKFRQIINQNEIQGKTAFRGLVRGKVKIILSNNDLTKLKKGEILVSQFTRPEYLLAMKKAAAIVTNDGGITSHASITARELKKPCIIDTKIATKAFKDGDLVEVDAEKGLVRKLLA